jgi:hypothetical protein
LPEANRISFVYKLMVSGTASTRLKPEARAVSASTDIPAPARYARAISRDLLAQGDPVATASALHKKSVSEFCGFAAVRAERLCLSAKPHSCFNRGYLPR